MRTAPRPPAGVSRQTRFSAPPRENRRGWGCGGTGDLGQKGEGESAMPRVGVGGEGKAEDRADHPGTSRNKAGLEAETGARCTPKKAPAERTPGRARQWGRRSAGSRCIGQKLSGKPSRGLRGRSSARGLRPLDPCGPARGFPANRYSGLCRAAAPTARTGPGAGPTHHPTPKPSSRQRLLKEAPPTNLGSR